MKRLTLYALGLVVLFSAVYLNMKWESEIAWNTPDALAVPGDFGNGDISLQYGIFYDDDELRRDIVIGSDPYSDEERARQPLDFRTYRRIEIPGEEYGVSWSPLGNFVAFHTVIDGTGRLVIFSFKENRVIEVPGSRRLVQHWWWDESTMVFGNVDGILQSYSLETGEVRLVAGFDGLIFSRPFRGGILVESYDPIVGITAMSFGSLTQLYERINQYSALPFVYKFDETLTLHEDVSVGEESNTYTFQGYLFLELCEGPQDAFCGFMIGSLDGRHWVREVDIEFAERGPFFELAARLGQAPATEESVGS